MNRRRAAALIAVTAMIITVFCMLIIDNVVTASGAEQHHAVMKRCHDRCGGSWRTLGCGQLDDIDPLYDGVEYSVCRVADPTGTVGYDAMLVFDHEHYEDERFTPGLPFTEPLYQLPPDRDDVRTWEM